MSDIDNHLEIYRERPCQLRWKVPAFCNNDWIALSLLAMSDNLGFGRPFDIVFGAPQNLWQGGRPALMRGPLSEDDLEKRFGAYDRFGVRCALTLRRPIRHYILKFHPAEGFRPRFFIDNRHTKKGQAIVTDDGLAAYIREQYPNLELVASFDRALVDTAPGMPDHDDETAYYTRTLSRFDEVVVRCEYALDDALIGQMSCDERARTEVIVNQICVPNCQRGREHVHAIEQWNEGLVGGPCQECFHGGVTANIKQRLANNVLMTNRRINELASLGVGTFKIGGRNAPIPKFLDLLGIYIYESSGAFVPMRVALSRQLTQYQAAHGSFAPYDLPFAV